MTPFWARVRAALLRLAGVVRPGAVNDRLTEEMQLHLEMEEAAQLGRGLSPAAARRAARLSFGATERFKDEARDAWRSRHGAELLQDLRYAVRAARRSPLLTSVVVATLALTLGLATAAFTGVNAVLLRALPYPAADQLVLLWRTERTGSDHGPVSFTNAMDWRDHVAALQSLAVFSCTARPILSGRGPADRLTMMQTSPAFFDVLEARPLLGRTFVAADGEAGNNAVLVLDYTRWRTQFGADSGIVNQRVTLDGVPYTVIGVLSPAFHPLPASLSCHPDVYRPLVARYDDAQRSWSFLRAVGRLRTGVSLDALRAEVGVEAARQAASYPDANAGHGADAGSLAVAVTRPIRPLLLLVQAGALLVLLIAAANVANLLLARATGRRREFALRMALGAGRARLARQIAAECLLFAAWGGAIGVVLAGFAAAIARTSSLGDLADVGLDPRVLAFAGLLTLGTAVGLTLAVVVASDAGDSATLFRALREGGRGTTAARGRLRRTLVATQVALALVALVGAGLLARSLGRLLAVSPGFSARGVLTALVSLPDATYPRGERQVAYFRSLTERLASLPGVTAAGAVSILPESPNFDQTSVRVVGQVYAPGTEPTPDVYRVTPGYFEALAIPLVQGRLFTATDDDRHAPVAVINQEMARTLFPGVSPLGRLMWTGAGDTVRTIVGVVGDVYQYGLDTRRTMQFYVPHAENSGGQLALVVRTTGDPAALGPSVRSIVRALDPDVPVDQIATMDEVLAASAGRRRILAAVSLALGIGALILAAIGLYGVMAYTVSQRTNEIGVRLALGATARDVLASVLHDGVRLALYGMVPGVVVAAVAGRLMSGLLFGVAASDLASYGAAACALLLVAVLACTMPARRAARLDPVVALRQD